MGVCAPNGTIFTKGKANSKKKAEQLASKKAMELLA
jgi:dsRNA-specific ribonuclease